MSIRNAFRSVVHYLVGAWLEVWPLLTGVGVIIAIGVGYFWYSTTPPSRYLPNGVYVKASVFYSRIETSADGNHLYVSDGDFVTVVNPTGKPHKVRISTGYGYGQPEAIPPHTSKVVNSYGYFDVSLKKEDMQ